MYTTIVTLTNTNAHNAFSFIRFFRITENKNTNILGAIATKIKITNVRTNVNVETLSEGPPKAIAPRTVKT